MAKVALSTKVPEELKVDLEEQAKEKGITLSEHVANLLMATKKTTENSEQEFDRLIKELEEKNLQIKEFQEMQKNEQQIRLYQEKQRLIEKEEEQKRINMIDEPKESEKSEAIKPKKKWWQRWNT